MDRVFEPDRLAIRNNRTICLLWAATAALFLVAIFFALVAVQFASMGLLAEVLIRTYHSANRRPPWTIARRLGSVD